MLKAPIVVDHRVASNIHIKTAAYHCAMALESLEAAAPSEAGYHMQVACGNIVFAAHHADEHERLSAYPIGGTEALAA